MKFLKKNDIQINNNLVSSIASKYNLNEDVVKLLFLRGIDTEESIDKFINIFSFIIVY